MENSTKRNANQFQVLLTDQQQREQGRQKGRSSCPPKRSQSTTSGPWILEWSKINSMEAQRRVKNGKNKQQPIIVTNKKEGGSIKLSARNLKRVARILVKIKDHH